MIQLFELTKTFGDRVLFDSVTWQIVARERVGLCGPNGAGKTTLLKMMAGLEEPDEGAILKPSTLTVGYLPQDGLNHAGKTVFEEASSAFARLLDMKVEMHELEDRLGDPSVPESDHEAILGRYSDLQDQFRLGDGYGTRTPRLVDQMVLPKPRKNRLTFMPDHFAVAKWPSSCSMIENSSAATKMIQPISRLIWLWPPSYSVSRRGLKPGTRFLSPRARSARGPGPWPTGRPRARRQFPRCRAPYRLAQRLPGRPCRRSR